MPTILRNPFRKNDENVRPAIAIEQAVNGVKPIDVKAPVEYKLSEINDSGICLPPSPPPERKSFWNSSRTTTSSTSTTQRSLFSENEPFNISRESFDSYRRSFDISGRSPVIQPNDAGRTRASLDSRTFLPPPSVRTSNSFTRPSAVPAQTQEETDTFEDVDIMDKPVVSLPQKKRGLFARLTDSGDQPQRPNSSDGKTSWHHFGGRKRGQSGQGAELGNMPVRRETTPKPESQLRKEAPKLVMPAVVAQDQAKVDTAATKHKQTISISTENQEAKKTPQPESQKDDAIETAQSALQDVSLDDEAPTTTPQPDVTKAEPSKGPASESERLPALQPKNIQAPEIRIES
ncbi:hypothetical protein EJ03DRAFT_51069 [Teratosphaeria nubilosa]|uniref:Uncharacterized protein n=1 Tax=Teratosphaeria nubilosa TaxID=161662 RepID=A0A6G1LEF0_9PEZI|nr:hypothetical protein EJ03DRAFT_51069 [Teratosphaeria nubilosa]